MANELKRGSGPLPEDAEEALRELRVARAVAHLLFSANADMVDPDGVGKVGFALVGMLDRGIGLLSPKEGEWAERT